MDLRPRGAADESSLSSKYKFLKTIGSGSFGIVRLAEKIATGEKVAIKMIDRKKLQDEKDIKQMELEIRMLTLLRHPNISLLHDVFSTDRHIYIALEYCSGGELFDYVVAKEVVKEKEARKLFRHLLSAIAFCHTNFVVHRDIKPENILLDKDMNARISDFGLSKCVRDGEMLKTSCGSPGYCPPEMLSEKLYDGKKADVWSMGVVLYVIVCGMLPFDGGNIGAMFARIKSGVYQLPPRLSSELKDLLGRMLVVDTERRATAEELLSHPWVVADEGPLSSFVPERGPIASVDDALVTEAVAFGIPEPDMRAAIAAGTPAPALAIYHLLNEKKQRTKVPEPAAGTVAKKLAAKKKGGKTLRVDSADAATIARRASIATTGTTSSTLEEPAPKSSMRVSAPVIDALPALKVEKLKTAKDKKASLTEPSRGRANTGVPDREALASPDSAPTSTTYTPPTPKTGLVESRSLDDFGGEPGTPSTPTIDAAAAAAQIKRSRALSKRSSSPLLPPASAAAKAAALALIDRPRSPGGTPSAGTSPRSPHTPSGSGANTPLRLDVGVPPTITESCLDLETMPLPSPGGSSGTSPITRAKEKPRDRSTPRSPMTTGFPKSPGGADEEEEDSDEEDVGKIRRVKGVSSCNATSVKTPLEICGEIERVLSEQHVDCERSGWVYDVLCRDKVVRTLLGVECGEAVKCSIEVCKVRGLPLHGLKWRRSGGDAWDYKKLVNILQKSMVL